MADALTTVTNFINSRPVVVDGGGLAAGFDRFDKPLDIEHKPVVFNFVAGFIVALVYWTAVIVNRVV